MVGFYCATLFQIFLTAIIRRKYYNDSEAVIFIVSPLKENIVDEKALLDYGFYKVIYVLQNDVEEGRDLLFDDMFFFTISVSHPLYLKSLNYQKLILAYEGITSFQLNHWKSGIKSLQFDLHEEISEFWFPDLDLLLDQEYLPKCKKFSLELEGIKQTDLMDFCTELNSIFKYRHEKINSNKMFLDRYLTRYIGAVLNLGIEKILTQYICHNFHTSLCIKKHPYDEDYLIKYDGLENVTILQDNVPYELVYLNELARTGESPIETYVFYNSFAPANLALLFGDTSFRCVCVEPLLNDYAEIGSSYLNADVTREVLNRFSEKYDVEVKYVSKLEELQDREKQSIYSTDDKLWKQVENSQTMQMRNLLLELRAFRLQLDCALISLKKKEGKYYFTAQNSSANKTKEILQIILPDFTEVETEAESDIIIDTDRTRVDYTKDSFDLEHFTVIEGYCRLTQHDSEIDMLLKDVDNIYIWGTTRTNNATFNILQKLDLTSKIRAVFDSYATGTNHSYPIIKFAPEMIERNCYIFVCAAVAYPEIAGILTGAGYHEGTEFGLGVGINRV